MEYFYYNETGERIGPFSITQIIELVKAGVIKRKTIIADKDGIKSSPAEKIQGLEFPPESQESEELVQEKQQYEEHVPNQTSPFKRQFVPIKYPNIDKAVHLLSVYFQVELGITIGICILIGFVILVSGDKSGLNLLLAVVVSLVGSGLAYILHIFEMMVVEFMKLMTHVAFDVHKTRWIAEEQMRKNPETK